MIVLCTRCNKPFDEDDAIMFQVEGLFHSIPSTNTWAIGQDSMIADLDTIKHKTCAFQKGDSSGD